MKRFNVRNGWLASSTRGSGEPVVFIHGAMFADAFLPLMQRPALSDHFKLVLYHRDGYGGSSRRKRTPSLTEDANDLRELLHVMGINRAHLAGHSYGGSVALQLALIDPALVHSLALIEPAIIAGASGDDYRQSLENGIVQFRAVGANTAIHEFLRARWHGSTDEIERAIPGSLSQAIHDAETAFERDIPALLQWTFDSIVSSRIHAHVMSIVGAESLQLWNRFGEIHTLLQGWFPGCEAHVLPRASHFPQLENPEGLATLLLAFFGRHPID